MPDGAEVAPGSDWGEWSKDCLSRVVNGRERIVDGHDAEVVTNALQHRDGSLTEACVAVYVDCNQEFGSDSAREFARLLMAAADELDGWAAK